MTLDPRCPLAHHASCFASECDTRCKFTEVTQEADLDDVVAEAVAAEREACARIVEQAIPDYDPHPRNWDHANDLITIAAAIRGRTDV